MLSQRLSQWTRRMSSRMILERRSLMDLWRVVYLFYRKWAALLRFLSPLMWFGVDKWGYITLPQCFLSDIQQTRKTLHVVSLVPRLCWFLFFVWLVSWLVGWLGGWIYEEYYLEKCILRSLLRSHTHKHSSSRVLDFYLVDGDSTSFIFIMWLICKILATLLRAWRKTWVQIHNHIVSI